jgi:hypothetical protein
MYGLTELRKACSNPHLIFREISRVYHRRLYTRSFNTEGTGLLEADWDNLILLDAWRFDTFKKRTSFDGTVDYRISRGAATPEFIRGNFAGKTIHDTVYFTENAWYFRLRQVVDTEVHHTEYADDRKVGPVTQKALRTSRNYPNKRLIVHLIPPHHPFRGRTAEASFPPFEEQSNALYERIQRGELDIDDQTLRRAYAENFDRVLPAVKTLLEELPGKTVVSADHGELLGDRTAPVPLRDYGQSHGPLFGRTSESTMLRTY